MAAVQAPLAFVQQILSQQASVPKPSEAVRATIAAIKDLCELNGTNDWRRGTVGASSYNSISSLGSQGSPRQQARGFRSTPTTPVASPVAAAGRRTPDSPMPPAHTPQNRYQSKFKNSTQPVEDKILNNIILSKLNKFSPATYVDVRDFLYQILGSGDADIAELIRDFMMLVFKKAASEEVYCALYAKLLAEISGRYQVILEEMKKLQSNYIDIFEDVEEIPEGGDDYNVFVAKNKEKRYRQGYSQFLAELTALEILELSTLQQTFTKLLSLIRQHGVGTDKKTLIEDYTDCLVRMTRVMKKRVTPFFCLARSSLLSLCGSSLAECIADKVNFPSISPKARFLLMDVKDILNGS